MGRTFEFRWRRAAWFVLPLLPFAVGCTFLSLREMGRDPIGAGVCLLFAFVWWLICALPVKRSFFYGLLVDSQRIQIVGLLKPLAFRWEDIRSLDYVPYGGDAIAREIVFQLDSDRIGIEGPDEKEETWEILPGLARERGIPVRLPGERWRRRWRDLRL